MKLNRICRVCYFYQKGEYTMNDNYTKFVLSGILVCLIFIAFKPNEKTDPQLTLNYEDYLNNPEKYGIPVRN